MVLTGAIAHTKSFTMRPPLTVFPNQIASFLAADIFWDAWGGRSQILEDTAANCSRGYLGTGLSTESWKLEIAESVETVAQLAKLRAAVNRVKVIVLLSPYRGMMLLL